MNPTQLIEQLAANARRIHALLEGVSPEQAGWKPDPDSWSVLEVINHLYDEEREDFRTHLDFILHPSAQGWHPIDPQGWVSARRYNERQLASSLQSFLAEREASLEWLKGLGEPDWEASVMAPFGEAIRAGDMLASWAAHDLLHMRQLVELHWAYARQLTDPFDVRYAGSW